MSRHGWARRKYPPLPHQDDVRPVGPADFLQEPVADWCVRDFSCHYEESMTLKDVTPRWFEGDTGSLLFEIMENPVALPEFLRGGDFIKELVGKQSTDILIPVQTDREDAETYPFPCTRLCFMIEFSLWKDFGNYLTLFQIC